jgi:hypothetical protein
MGNVMELLGQVEILAARLTGVDVLGGDAWDIRAGLVDNQVSGLTAAGSFAATAAAVAWEFEAGSEEPAIQAAAARLASLAMDLRRASDDALEALRREVE